MFDACVIFLLLMREIFALDMSQERSSRVSWVRFLHLLCKSLPRGKAFPVN